MRDAARARALACLTAGIALTAPENEHCPVAATAVITLRIPTCSADDAADATADALHAAAAQLRAVPESILGAVVNMAADEAPRARARIIVSIAGREVAVLAPTGDAHTPPPRGWEAAVPGWALHWHEPGATGTHFQRRIFLTVPGSGLADAPPRIRAWCRSWLERSPGWAVQVQGDAEIAADVARLAPRARAAYEALPTGIMRADAWRLLRLCCGPGGGLYVDADVACARPAEELLAALPRGPRVAMPENHPAHAITDGRPPDLMNNLIAARGPRPAFLVAACGALALGPAPGAPDTFLAHTGPIMLGALRAGMDPRAITVLPWRWVNPLPDLARDWPALRAPGLRAFYGDVLAAGDEQRRLAPFAVHYWWHAYERESPRGAESGAGELAPPPPRWDAARRARRLMTWLGPARGALVARALAHAAPGRARIVEWIGGAAAPPPVDASRPDIAALAPHPCVLPLALECLLGAEAPEAYTVVAPSAAVCAWAEDAARALGAAPGVVRTVNLPPAAWVARARDVVDLLVLTNGGGVAALNDVRAALEAGVVARGGLVLFEGVNEAAAAALGLAPPLAHTGPMMLCARGRVVSGSHGGGERCDGATA